LFAATRLRNTIGEGTETDVSNDTGLLVISARGIGLCGVFGLSFSTVLVAYVFQLDVVSGSRRSGGGDDDGGSGGIMVSKDPSLEPVGGPAELAVVPSVGLSAP
jgi:hypothetical protein